MDLSGLTKMHVTFKTKQRHNEINTYKKYFVRVYNAIMPCLMGTSTTYIIYVCYVNLFACSYLCVNRKGCTGRTRLINFLIRALDVSYGYYVYMYT